MAPLSGVERLRAIVSEKTLEAAARSLTQALLPYLKALEPVEKVATEPLDSSKAGSKRQKRVSTPKTGVAKGHEGVFQQPTIFWKLKAIGVRFIRLLHT
jgi:hypothetical protein